MQAQAMVLYDWLFTHSLDSLVNVSLIHQEFFSLAMKTLARKKARKEITELKWSESALYVRICHAVADIEENMESFILRFRVMTRENLD